MLHEESVGGDEGDGLPGAAVEETVRLTGCDLEVDGFRAEGFPFGVRGVPALFPRVLISKESDGGRKIGLQMAQDVDLGVDVVIGSEGGIEPHISDDAGIDVLRVRRVVEAGIHRGEGADVPACRSAARDDALRVDAEFVRVLFEPADCAFGIGDTHAFAGFTRGQLGGVGLAEHLIFCCGTDESATGKVGAGDAKLS